MKAFVTGSTGLLGNNLIHALIDAGYDVKALVRSTEKAQKLLAHLDIDLIQGDMLDVSAFADEMADCDILFHCAAYFREYYSSGEHQKMLDDVNVQGTINILNMAEAQGIKKTIYVSSSGVIGLTIDGSLGDESTPPDPALLENLYFASKIKAEEKIADWLKTHTMPIVLILPSAIYGPRDAAPTSAGQMIIDYIHGDLPAVPSGGFSLVDARDVAQAMIQAVDKGKSGERYIVSNTSYSIKEILSILSDLSGRPMPLFNLSYSFGLVFAHFSEFMARFTGKEPLATVSAIKTLNMRREMTSAKAQRDLGIDFRPFEETLYDELNWYLDNGYIKNPQSLKSKLATQSS